MSEKFETLSKIAEGYHLAAESPDMHIENATQKHELGSLLQLVPEGSSLLELGFGDGITFRALSRHAEYSLVEAVPSLCERAKLIANETDVDVEIHCSFFEDFEPLRRYDFIYASHVLEHVESPGVLLRKMKDWLNPGGRLIVIVPNAESLHRVNAKFRGIIESVYDLSERDQVVGHLRVYDRVTLCSEIESSGYRIEKVFGSFLKPLPNAELLRLTPSEIALLLNLSDKFPPEMLANLIVIATPSSP